MIYTPLTRKAMQTAYDAHHGQVDKAGVPYILHPFHVAQSMEDEISCCVALLHDVLEDTDVTFDQLAAVFPPEVMDALKLLTHAKDTPYEDYVRAIRTNPIAVTVKLADIAHNSDQSRMAGTDVSEEILAYFRSKYDKAKALLLED